MLIYIYIYIYTFADVHVSTGQKWHVVCCNCMSGGDVIVLTIQAWTKRDIYIYTYIYIYLCMCESRYVFFYSSTNRAAAIRTSIHIYTHIKMVESI